MQETQVLFLSHEDRRKRQPTQHSNLRNPMNKGVWWTIVQEVAKNQTQLSVHVCRGTHIINFTFHKRTPRLS